MHGLRRFIVHPDDDEKPGFPLNRDRHADLAFPGNHRVYFPVAGLRPQLDMRRTFAYIDAVGYPGFPAGKPFIPFFMASDQVWDEVPAFAVYPQIDRFIVGFKFGEIKGEPAGDTLEGPAVVDQIAFHIGFDRRVGRTFPGVAAAGPVLGPSLGSVSPVFDFV
jgi:hypothetical protein